MASTDYDSLATPVGTDHPAGQDLEYDPIYTAMEKAAAGKPEQQMGDAVIEAEEPDWKLVQKHATALLERSKDLRICVYLCRAALRNEGFEGLGNSLQLMARLIEDFWDALYPELDEDDDNDPTARVNAVMALASPSDLLRPVEEAPLLSVPMLGAVRWTDVKPTAGDDEPQQPSAEIHAIIHNCELDQIASRRSALAMARESCRAIETRITDRVGTSQAPNLQPLRDLLRRIDDQLGRWWTERGGDAASEEAESDEPTSEIGESAPAVAEHASARSSGEPQHAGRGGSNGAILSRQEVILAIDKILAYYQKYEPSSPLPLLLLRAKRLATKSFIEILQDLIPEGLDRAHEIGGIAKGSMAISAPAETFDHASDDYPTASEPDEPVGTTGDDLNDFFS